MVIPIRDTDTDRVRSEIRQLRNCLDDSEIENMKRTCPTMMRTLDELIESRKEERFQQIQPKDSSVLSGRE